MRTRDRQSNTKAATFNWDATDKYSEGKAFILEVKKCTVHLQHTSA